MVIAIMQSKVILAYWNVQSQYVDDCIVAP